MPPPAPPLSKPANADTVQLRATRGGVLLDADAELLSIELRAGGAVGRRLAVPQWAALVALAASLDLPVARSIVVAEGDDDVAMRVEARPSASEVVLSVSAICRSEPRSSHMTGDNPSPTQRASQWRWRSDAQLCLTELVFAPDDAATALRDQWLGKPLTRIVRLVEDASGDLAIVGALAARRAFTDQRAVRRDQPEVEIALAAEPLFSDGHFVGFSGTAGPLVEVAPEVETDFAERLTKALRRPLDRIVTRADSIAAQSEGPLRRDYADYAGDIAAAARHLLALVEDMADAEAIERADFRIAVEPIDLADLARRAAGLLQVRAAAGGVRIDRPALLETQIASGDFRRVLQILVNLIGNAVRYSPTGSAIWLRVEAQDDSVAVIVADQGKGIAAEDHERVFEKFERVDPSEPGGSGLGLYISRRLARAMGGDITLDSAPGQGARFVLVLPA